MRELDFEQASDLVICPYSALLPPPHLARSATRVRARRRVRSGREGASPGTHSSSTIDVAAASTGQWRGTSRVRHLTDVRAGRQPRRHHARGRPRALALVGHALRVGRPARRRGARDRGALRLVRPPAVRRREPRVRLGRPQARMTLYDAIASLLRPVEPLGHRGRRLLRRGRRSLSGGRSSSSPSAPGGSPSRSREAGVRVIGVDFSPGMLAVARARGRGARRRASSSTSALGDLREPPVDRARAARHLPVPLARCTWRPRRRSCARSARRTRPARAGRPLRLRRLRARAARTSRRRTAAGSSASRASSSAPTGTRARERSRSRCARRRSDGDVRPALAVARPEWLRLLDDGRLRRSRRCTAGSTAGPTTATRTWSSSPRRPR